MGSEDPLATLVNFGTLGIFLILWLTGYVVSRAEHAKAEGRAEEWKQLYLQESAAHRDTRAALDRERDRSEAGVEAGRTAAALLNVLGHHSLPGGGT